jgi:hypothetical protein
MTMKAEDQTMNQVAVEDPNQTMGESLIDVLSLEVLGPLSRTLHLLDSEYGPDNDDFYALRDAYILAMQHLGAICDVIERDVGDLQIVAPWGKSILENRTYKRAFIEKGVEG